MSLQDKLLWMNALTIAIPIFILSVCFFTVHINYVNNRLASSALQSVKQLSASLDSYIKRIESLSFSMSSIDSMRMANGYKDKDSVSVEKINSFMRNIVVMNNEILGVYLLCESGGSFKVVRGDNFSPLDNFKDQKFYQAAKKDRNKGMWFYSNVLKEYVRYDEKVLTYAIGLEDPVTNEYLGEIIFSIDEDKIGEITSAYGANETSMFVITNDSGRILYHPLYDYVDKTILDYYFSKAVLSKTEGFSTAESADGKQIGLFFMTSPDTRLKTTNFILMSEFYAPVEELKILYMSIFIVMILVLIVISKAFFGKITKPIMQLTKNVEKFGEGKLDFDTNINSNDEIGKLSAAFTEMTGRIQFLIYNIFCFQLKQKEAELDALQSKINPHFLYNTLETLASMVEANETDQASGAMRDLGQILRYSLSRSNELSTVKKELKYVKQYISIQKLRFGKRLNVIYDISSDILECSFLKLLIQPIVENAIVHGIEAKSDKGAIIISGRMEDDMLIISIRDTGIGMDEETLNVVQKITETGINDFDLEKNDGNRGFAFSNIYWRLKLKYGSKNRIVVKSKKGEGTEVVLYITGRI